jgi:hypothetical protein
MNLFKKEPEVEFFSLMPEIVDIAPIQNARNFRPDLLVNASKDFAEKKKDPAFGLTRLISTAKCPGVYNYVRHGWVMTTWQDFVIETNGDSETFLWTTPVDQARRATVPTVGDMIEGHSKQQYADYIGGTIPNSLSTVIKINTPWRCIVPKGYYLEEGPLPYTSEKRFTTVPGYFDRESGVAQMNVQILWHVMKGKTLIKAGTPIAHYRLIPIEQPKMKCMAANEDQLYYERVHHLATNKRNVTDIKERKCFFAELFK